MGFRELVAERVRKFKELLSRGIDPFKEKRFEVSAYSIDIKREFSYLSPGEETEQRVSVAGRILSRRGHGKIVFVDLLDAKGNIQLVFRADVTKDFDLVKLLDRGDIVGVKGRVIKTKRGEVSVLVEEFKVLAKALRPLPDTWYGLKDVERRYRERYVDLILNPEVKERFIKIHEILLETRRFFNERGFVEVLTPILQPVYGGAFARPFKTHHHFLDMDMYLRIAPELYLKRLIVGGFEKVYEVSVNFRNEDVDATHNPEFYQIEAYWAYADYRDMMDLVEDYVTRLVEKLHGTHTLEWMGKEIDFRKPWERMRLVDAIREFGGPDVESMKEEEVIKHARSLGYDVIRFGEALEKLFDHYAAPHVVNPTFITHYPVDISPLAKRSEDPRYVERFELFINGMEFANAYSELNNPIEQYKRFKEEEELRKRIKKEGLEYQPMDRDFVRALEYGMPPTGGIGIGLTRLFMVLTNAATIKEVILFPALAPEKEIPLVVELFPELLELYE
ncbi:MAG: lysine--tRNA ligase [Candidatus Diapherotrites archaeon]|nr:lysine--tRNA ligase [Candidatus Diapherotrites archaeon]